MARKPKLVSMELDDEDMIDTVMPIPMRHGGYPCGLRICLTHKEMPKLGLEADCKHGDVLSIRAEARVTSFYQDDESCRVELQIERMSALDDEPDGDDDDK